MVLEWRMGEIGSISMMCLHTKRDQIGHVKTRRKRKGNKYFALFSVIRKRARADTFKNALVR